MKTANESNQMSAISILFFAGLSLIFGHLLLQQWMPNIAFGVLGFVILILTLGYPLFVKNDVFGFIMIIFIGSHFSYGDNHGGLWNIMASVMLVLYFLSGRNKPEFKQSDTAINILLGIFIFFNVLGWLIKNPMPLIPLFEGASAFIAYMLTYLVISKIEITSKRFQIFLIIVFFLLLYQMAVALNQYYSVINVGSPLLGGNTLNIGKVTESGRPAGTIGHFELFSEYALLMICLLIPLLSSKFTKTEIKFSYLAISIMILTCVAIIIITTMRGAFILAILVTIFYYLFFPFKIVKAVNKVTNQLKVIILLALLLPTVSLYIGIHEFERDFARLNFEKMNVENIVSGKSINRSGLAEAAFRRMDSESWFIGHGSGTYTSNAWAWFGFDVSKRKNTPMDYHNLYVSLPMIYGWVGSLAFLGIILLTLFNLLFTTLKYRQKESFLLVISFGLTVMWGTFLIHEYKISILRNANYQMLFWIWLGLSASVIKTIKDKWANKQKPENSYKLIPVNTKALPNINQKV